MADYYCRLCNDFVYGEDAEIVKHYSGFSNQDELLLFETLNCPKCGEELIELADECICGDLKLEKDTLCRRCKKIASSEWQNCIDAVHRQLKGLKSDAEEVMETYVDKEIIKK